MAQELKKAEPQEVNVVQSPTPMHMLQIAVEQGHDLERIEKLMELERRWKADKAREAYYEALAKFKQQPLTVTKDKKNNQYDSRYTSIGNLVNTVNTAMAPFGLNARWEINQETIISVTCILAHTLGHSERVTMSGLPDDSGKKNALQQIKSTVTYLESATFQAVTGVVSQDANVDDDGNGAGPAKITEQQVADLEAKIEEVGATKAKFLKVAKVESLEEITADRYANAIGWLNQYGAKK